MDQLDFKKPNDENEEFANNLFAQVVTEKDQEATKKKASLYGQFAEAAEAGKTLEEKTAEKIAEAGEVAKMQTEPLMMDVSSAVDEPKEGPNKINIFLTAALALSLAFFTFAVGMFIGRKAILKKVNPNATVNFTADNLDTNETAKMQAAYEFVIDNYYADVDPNKLIEGAISGMIAALDDPYGGYLKPENMQEYTEYIEGKDEEGKHVPTVSFELLDKQVYRIKIDQFTEGTSKEFKDAVDEIAKKGCKGLIIDLRDNPGGFADESVRVADIILPSGVVATARDKNGKITTTHKSDANEIGVPVCLLVNEKTASAAELVTGAFRDMKKGEIIGKHTYGKALAQITAKFDSDGSGIVLSAFTYFTPSGECIDKKGIEPTIIVENDPESDKDLQLERALEEILKNV